jgi:hypothetical protein
MAPEVRVGSKTERLAFFARVEQLIDQSFLREALDAADTRNGDEAAN